MIDFPFDAVPTTTPAAHSRYVQRVRRRYADEIARFAQTAPGTPRTAQITALIAHLLRAQREATDVRLIMAGKLNGFKPEELEERVRELHG